MLILKLLVFAIPSTIAAIMHMVAVKLDIFSFLKVPIDLGMKINGKRLFGENKTFRGVVLMVAFSILGVYFLAFLANRFPSISAYNVLKFDLYSPILYGVLLGFAYTLFELPNSFIKRQRGIEGGKRGKWFNVVFDQIDSPIGCMLVLIPFAHIDFQFFAAGVLFYLFLHMFFNIILFILKLRSNPL